MATRKLTTIFVEKVQPPTDKPQEDYFDTVLPSFGLRVGRRSKTYFLMARVLKEGDWKLTRVKLGTAVEMDLATAREQARGAMERAEKGEAPAEVRRERREQQQRESRDTFSRVRESFLAGYRTRSKRKPSERTLAEIKRVLSSAAFQDWEDRPLVQITQTDIERIRDDLLARGHEAAANRYLVYVKMFFKWARKKRVITTDPAAEVEKEGAEGSRERVLTLPELKAVWQALAPTQANKGDLFEGIIKVLILTGQRRNEVAGMRWSELDLDAGLWSLPEDRTKNHRPHLVPLPDPVKDVLRERQAEQKAMGMRTPYVFTSTGGAPFSGWSKSKVRLDGRAGIAPWTLHDLRRTLVTRLSEDLRIPPHIVEAIVNHVSGTKAGVAGTYNRAMYLDERRNALGAWAAYVLRLVGEVTGTNVVELAR